MDEARGQVAQIELLWGRPEVAIPVHIPLQRAVDTGQHGIRSDVKLTAVDQQGFIEVALNNRSSIAISLCNLLNYTFYLA